MSTSFESKYNDTVSMILDECSTALNHIDPAQVEALVKAMLSARKVFVIAVGRVMLSLEAFAKRMSHIGVGMVCVGQITEPAITTQDLLLVASGSGESAIPVAIAKKAASLKVKIAYVGSNMDSSVAKLAALMVRIPVQTKSGRADEIASQQPMTSMFEQSLLLLGDAIAKIIINNNNIDMKSLWQQHANLE